MLNFLAKTFVASTFLPNTDINLEFEVDFIECPKADAIEPEPIIPQLICFMIQFFAFYFKN